MERIGAGGVELSEEGGWVVLAQVAQHLDRVRVRGRARVRDRVGVGVRVRDRVRLSSAAPSPDH